MNGQNDQSRLQSLLLAQTLATCSSTSTAAVFDHVSAQLRQSSFFASDDSTAASQFTPDSLKTLYLSLAKEEARREVNGARSSPRRKSPPPPQKSSKHETAPDFQYGRRAAEMVPHLFDEYRDQIIREIREEERKYKVLTDELKTLSHGKEAPTSKQDRTVSVGRLEGASLSESPAPALGGAAPRGQAKQGRPAAVDTMINHEESKADFANKPRPVSSSTPDVVGHRPSPGPQSGTLGQPPDATSRPLTGHDVYAPPAVGAVPAAEAFQQPPPQVWQNGNGRHLKPSRGMTSSPRAARSGDVEHHPHEVNASPHFNEAWLQQQLASPARPPATAQQQQQSPYVPAQLASQQTPSYSQQRGGVMLPPFQLSTQPTPSESRSPVTAAHGKRVPEPLQLSQIKASGSGTPQRPLSANRAFTPLSGPNGSHLVDSGTYVSPGSSTRWKPETGVSERAAPRDRSVSPLSEPEDVGTGNEGKSGPSISKRGRRGKGVETGRGRGTGRRRATATSSMRVASPSARSQSTSSQVDEPFRHPSALRQKNEVPGTPGAPSVSGDETITSTTTRQSRRGVAQRRRAVSTTETNPSVDEETMVQPRSPVVAHYQPPPNTVVATRNLVKVSQPLLDMIGGHKHGGTFKERITNKQAEGYDSIVRVGQDLKSIRVALKNGEKAVNAATAEEGSPGGGTMLGSVILPASEALMPPKSIVNAAQLEAEIYRMLANCVMFNAGDETYIAEAREMFVDVEREIQNWRSTEGVHDAARDEEAGPSSKRRRL